ncbi:unnamed protein product [Mycena citricolor]|uniref:Uncharacterized protein n=1 Tax=Mycena citricolor TaxID=2018698 RepID=A0AAD2HVA3_9AGAR|nr:unnamed protein product [Mycena citricolor]
MDAWQPIYVAFILTATESGHGDQQIHRAQVPTRKAHFVFLSAAEFTMERAFWLLLPLSAFQPTRSREICLTLPTMKNPRAPDLELALSV